ncbi:hypothetical protein [Streptomyces sp. JW3]|uniref:hypothetical protein n=1 Tax=Streptomyces sp. JW3 TaxID=3456955 RepID=UPI003FA41C7B
MSSGTGEQIEDALADTIEQVEANGWALERMTGLSSGDSSAFGTYSVVLVFRRG